MFTRLRFYQLLFLAPALVLLTVFLLLPLIGILPFSFGQASRTTFATGPFTPEQYVTVVRDPFLRGVLLRTFLIALATTALALALSLPVTYYLSRSGHRLKGPLMIILLFPLLAGGVVQSIGWVALLSPSGIISQVVQNIGLADAPIDIMQRVVTITVIMALICLPMMVLSIQSSMDAVPEATERAAQSLGATRWRAFWTVLFPQIMPGLIAGTSICFVLTVNAYPTPVLIGGQRIRMASPEIYSIVSQTGNWALATAFALVVVLLSLATTGLYGYVMTRVFDSWRR